MSLVATGAVAWPVPPLEAGQQREPGAARQQAEPATGLVDLFAVIDAQLDAFNAHDVNAMVANLAEDFAWFAVDLDMTRVELRGREEFRRSREPCFASVRGARAEIEERLSVGRFVAVRECVYWIQGGEEVSQASLPVCEICDGRIRQGWYCPVQ